MALQKINPINRTKVREMYRRGAFKDVGTFKLASGETVSDAKFRKYLEEKAAQYGTVTSLMEAVKKDTARSQWRQRVRLGKAFTEPVASKQSLTQQKEKTQRHQSILGSFLGREKEEKKPPVAPYLRAKAGSWNYRTGKYEATDINQRPGMVGSQQSNKSSIGVGSQEQMHMRTHTGISDLTNRNAEGIGGDKSGFQTIGSNLNKK